MHVTIIGSGSIGRRHASNLEALGVSFSLISWRISSTSFSQLVLEQKSDYVFICTGTNVRRILFEFCFTYNIPFLVEKPVAFFTEDLDYLYSLPSSFLDKCFVGFMQRYSPLASHLISTVVSPIHTSYFEFGHNVFEWRNNWNFSQSYASKLCGGGVTLDLCHDIDIIHLLFDVETIDSVICKSHPEYSEIDFVSSIKLSNRKGSQSLVNLDYIRSQYIHRGLVLSSTDSMSFDFVSGAFVSDSSNLLFPPLSVPYNRNRMFLDMLEHFLFDNAPPYFNPANIPRLSNTRRINYLISSIWSQRSFQGTI